MGGNLYGGFMWAHASLGISQPLPPLNSEMKTPQLAAATRRNLKAWMRKYQPDAVLTTAPEAPGA